MNPNVLFAFYMQQIISFYDLHFAHLRSSTSFQQQILKRTYSREKITKRFIFLTEKMSNLLFEQFWVDNNII